MSEAAFVNDARVMSKGQVTIPKNVRAVLGINTGDRVTFIVEGDTVMPLAFRTSCIRLPTFCVSTSILLTGSNLTVRRILTGVHAINPP